MTTVEKHYAEAKRILLDSGFVSDFHCIINVMNGNKGLTKVTPECSTRKWGVKVLQQKLDFLKRKYDDYKQALEKESCYYFITLSSIHSDVMDCIIKNAINEIDEKANNSD